MSKPDYICPRKHVAKKDIDKAVAAGAKNLHDIKKMTKATTKCGKCTKQVEKYLEQALAKGKTNKPADAGSTVAPVPSPASAPAPAPAVTTAAAGELVIHGVYRHFKGGFYLVEDIARDSETEAELVIYRKLYGDGSLWARPKEMFLSPVERERYSDVAQDLRFELVEGLPEVAAE